MKVWVLLCTLFQICFAVPNTSHTILLEKINSRHSSWKAAKLFTEDTPEEFLKHRLGFLGVGRDANINIKSHKTDTITIPESFDAREHWPGCEDVIGNIRDQGGCGSCWAFSSVEVMSDRLCIESEGEIKFELSPQNLVSCCRDCGYGCEGGYTYMAWNYFQKHGIVSGGDYNSSRGCQPYEALAFINGTTPECKESCQNPSYLTSYSTDLRLGDHYDQISPDVETIQVEIMTNGPVQASYTVYEDFGYYVSGVYQHIAGKRLGGHAIKIIGWGTENGTPYWLVANSWGTSWASLNGYFKIKRGSNECGIEDRVYAGVTLKKSTHDIEGGRGSSIQVSSCSFGFFISCLLLFYFF